MIKPHDMESGHVLYHNGFIYVLGSAHKTDVTVGADQETDVDLSMWRKFRTKKFEDSNYVSYYVDKKKLH